MDRVHRVIWVHILYTSRDEPCEGLSHSYVHIYIKYQLINCRYPATSCLLLNNNDTYCFMPEMGVGIHVFFL